MIYKVSQQKLVLEIANELKNHIEMPKWALFVKTGAHKETMPRNPDWWYIRAASILRIAFKQGPIGTNKLRTRYGGRKNRGVMPDRFKLASRKIIRTILQQLEKAELVKQETVGVHKGRSATPAGISLIAKAAKAVAAKEPKTTSKTPTTEQKPAIDKKEEKKEKVTKEKIKAEKPKKVAKEKVEKKTKLEKKEEEPIDTQKAEEPNKSSQTTEKKPESEAPITEKSGGEN